MGLDVQGLMHVGYRIGTQADQVPAIVAFYKSVFDLDIDSNRPTIPTIPGAWVQLPNSSVKPQFHLMVARGIARCAQCASGSYTHSYCTGRERPPDGKTSRDSGGNRLLGLQGIGWDGLRSGLF